MYNQGHFIEIKIQLLQVIHSLKLPVIIKIIYLGMERVTDLSLWQIVYTARKKEPQSLLIKSSETEKVLQNTVISGVTFRHGIKGK